MLESNDWRKNLSEQEMTVSSPCIEVCEIDRSVGLCIGCLRTPLEIETWCFMTNDHKKRMLVELKEREERYGAYGED